MFFFVFFSFAEYQTATVTILATLYSNSNPFIRLAFIFLSGIRRSVSHPFVFFLDARDGDREYRSFFLGGLGLLSISREKTHACHSLPKSKRRSFRMREIFIFISFVCFLDSQFPTFSSRTRVLVKLRQQKKKKETPDEISR